MSLDNKKNQGFESEESWLNDQLHDADEPNTDFIKLRMRIEVQEQWLQQHWQHEDLIGTTVDLRRTLRERVRQEIKSVQAEQGQNHRKRLMGWSLWIGAAAAAAAIVLVTSQPPRVEENLADESTTWISAFEAYSTDALDTEMSAIDSELNTIASSLVALDNPWLDDDWTSKPTDFEENGINNAGLLEKSRSHGEGMESGT